MKIYFDSLEPHQSNLLNLQSNGEQKFWLVSAGTVLKKKLQELGHTIDLLDNPADPGCYFIDVNGDPIWWSGIASGDNVPLSHVISKLPEDLVNLIKLKKIRIILAADKEGGSMNFKNQNAFLSTTNAMIQRGLPKNSILIIQGNSKISNDYDLWLKENNLPKMFEVQFSSHFTELFFNKFNLPLEPLFNISINSAKFDFNSLNRVYRSHRGAHCYYLVKNNLLNNGIVSCNQISLTDDTGAALVEIDTPSFTEILQSNFPKFVDGNWSNINAAEHHNFDVYKNSLISFITETKFDEEVVFPTEKIYKPIAFGHPLILLASAGTLRAIEKLGFRIDWCGIDPSYNDIVDHKTRFVETHNILKWWISLPREEKVDRILKSKETIEHNFRLIREKSFYNESLNQAIENSRSYFNDGL
jgi:hypothetical protein